MPTSQHVENVYQAIHACMQERGVSPSIREVCESTGFTMQMVRLCLYRLEAQGRIRRQAGTARSIVLLDPDNSQTGC